MTKYEKIFLKSNFNNEFIFNYLNKNSLIKDNYLYRIITGPNRLTQRFLQTGTDIQQPKQQLDDIKRNYIELFSNIELEDIILKNIHKIGKEQKISFFIGIYKKQYLEWLGDNLHTFGDTKNNKQRLKALEKLLRFTLNN